jgi:hypothetical protein
MKVQLPGRKTMHKRRKLRINTENDINVAESLFSLNISQSSTLQALEQRQQESVISRS